MVPISTTPSTTNHVVHSDQTALASLEAPRTAPSVVTLVGTNLTPMRKEIAGILDRLNQYARFETVTEEVLLRFPAQIEKIAERQEAIRELMLTPSLLDSYMVFLSKAQILKEGIDSLLARKETPRYNRESGVFEDAYDYEQVIYDYLKVHSAAKALREAGEKLPSSQSVWLKEQYTAYQEFLSSPLMSLMAEPIGLERGQLLPRSKMGFISGNLHPFRPAVPGSPTWYLAGGALLTMFAAFSFLNSLGTVACFGQFIVFFSLMLWGVGCMVDAIHHKAKRDANLFVLPLRDEIKSADSLNTFYDRSREVGKVLALAAWYKTIPSDIPMVFPKLVESPHHILKAESLYSPFWVATEKRNTVPIDVKIDREGFIIITGPNSGGKTAFCKTAQLTEILAGNGGIVFARQMVKSALLDMGFIGPKSNTQQDDEGQLGVELGDVYTFIRSNLSPKRFLVLDEVGRGTSRKEGEDIAERAVLTAAASGCTIIWPTHELDLARRLVESGVAEGLQVETIENVPTFRLVPGVALHSDAERVAKRVGFPPKKENIPSFLSSLGIAGYDRKAKR